jgi:hypothetical protein
MVHFILGVIALMAAIFIWNELLSPAVVERAERRAGKRAGGVARLILFVCAMLQCAEAIALIVLITPFFAFLWTLETIRTKFAVGSWQ